MTRSLGSRLTVLLASLVLMQAFGLTFVADSEASVACSTADVSAILVISNPTPVQVGQSSVLEVEARNSSGIPCSGIGLYFYGSEDPTPEFADGSYNGYEPSDGNGRARFTRTLDHAGTQYWWVWADNGAIGYPYCWKCPDNSEVQAKGTTQWGSSPTPSPTPTPAATVTPTPAPSPSTSVTPTPSPSASPTSPTGTWSRQLLISASPTDVEYGDPVTLYAQVVAEDGAPADCIAEVPVFFSANGAQVLGLTTDASGHASYTYTAAESGHSFAGPYVEIQGEVEEAPGCMATRSNIVGVTARKAPVVIKQSRVTIQGALGSSAGSGTRLLFTGEVKGCRGNSVALIRKGVGIISVDKRLGYFDTDPYNYGFQYTGEYRISVRAREGVYFVRARVGSSCEGSKSADVRTGAFLDEDVVNGYWDSSISASRGTLRVRNLTSIKLWAIVCRIKAVRDGRVIARMRLDILQVGAGQTRRDGFYLHSGRRPSRLRASCSI